MRKIWTVYFVASVLGWLLAWGSLPAGAYYPPLKASASKSDNTITLDVWDPEDQTGRQGGATYGPGITIDDLEQKDGVMAWVSTDGSNYQVTCCVYDPFLKTFQSESLGPYTQIDQLTVADGVVAFIANESQFNYTTYDPAKAAWQNRSYSPEDDPYISSAFGLTYVTNSGVLLFSYQYYSSAIYLNYAWDVDVYDPILGKWSTEGVSTIGGSSNAPFQNLTLNYGTVSYTVPSNKPNETITKTAGYDLGQHSWGWKPTKAGAYFVAQPTSGSSPLWVWFTDMSIGGTDWSWMFSDGGTSTSRSPSHTFQSDGYFPVTQTVKGNGTSHYKKTILVGVPPSLVWMTAYSSMMGQEDLALLRRYRDEVLVKIPRGKIYKTLLYDNSDAALKVLVDNLELMSQAQILIHDNMGAVIQVLQGHEGIIYNPEEVLAFLEAYEDQAPPQLRALINVVRKEMRQSQREKKPFLGFRLGE